MDRFAAMRAFVGVVDAGSFTRAANNLALPASTVTRYVQSLERQLRIRLLNRSTRRISLTDEGASYYERVDAILEELDSLETTLSQTGKSPRGMLRVSMPGELGSTLVVPALADFVSRFPEIELDVRYSGQAVDMVRDNIDCALCVGPVAELSIVARRIAEVDMVLCASPSYILRRGEPGHPTDLQDGNHRVVRLGVGAKGRSQPLCLSRGSERVEVRMEAAPGISIQDAVGHVTAGLAGLGVVQVLGFIVQRHLDNGSMRAVLTDWASQPVPIHVVYRPDRHLARKLRTFIDWVAHLFATHELLAPECRREPGAPTPRRGLERPIGRNQELELIG